MTILPWGETGRRCAEKLLLTVAYLMFVTAVIIAYTSPANEYEVSIYQSTPTLYWVGIAVAIVVALAVMTFSNDESQRRFSLLLAGLTTTSVVALPILRSYYFYGLNDSLTHLGWTRALANGDIGPMEMVYPGTHMIAVFFHELAGFSVEWSMQIVLVLLTLLFFVFLPLSAREVISDRRIVYLTAVSAFLVLPVNNVGVHMMFMPFTGALFFFALVLYLLFKYTLQDSDTLQESTEGWGGWPRKDRLRRSTENGLRRYLSTAGLMLITAEAALVLFHPQVAVNALIVFFTMSGVQFFYRRQIKDHPIASSRAIYGQTIILTIIFLAWTSGDGHFVRYLDQITTAATSLFSGSPETGQAINQRGSSLSELGTSLAELFVKLFLVSFVYVILSVALVVTKLAGRLDPNENRSSTVIMYFTYFGFAWAPFIVLHNIGGLSENTYLFRYVGFGMVVGTLLGSISLYFATVRFRLRNPFDSDPVLRAVAVVFAVCLVALSWQVLFHSPYMFKRTQHVTEYQMSGYETAFEYQNDEVPFSGVRALRHRYADVLYEQEEPTWSWNEGRKEISVPESVLLHNLSSYYERPHYLPVTDETIGREVVAYRELRYSRASFEAIEGYSGVHRVQSNGGFVLYYVEGRESGNEG